MEKTHENDFAIYLMTDELLHIIYKKVHCVDLMAAQLVVRDRMQIQEGKEMPVLCDIRELRTINKAARDYLALEGSLWVKALALLIDPPVTDDLSTFYLNIHPSKIPTASFTTKSEALAFLHAYIP